MQAVTLGIKFVCPFFAKAVDFLCERLGIEAEAAGHVSRGWPET